MNFKMTAELLEILKPYTENAFITVSAENKDYKSDLVTVDEKNQVGFEVFENEIIAYYFTGHYHFEDYTSELQEGQAPYPERAKEFLLELFQYKIRHDEFYKGKTLSSEKYYILYHHGREECIGNTWFGFERFVNPFGKKTCRSTIWQFDRSKGFFTARHPKNVDPNAIEVIDISDDCYIEIFRDQQTFAYEIMEMVFDDYSCMYYWAPAAKTTPSGIYDTKENAIASAKDALKNRGCD